MRDDIRADHIILDGFEPARSKASLRSVLDSILLTPRHLPLHNEHLRDDLSRVDHAARNRPLPRVSPFDDAHLQRVARFRRVVSANGYGRGGVRFEGLGVRGVSPLDDAHLQRAARLRQVVSAEGG